MSSEAFPSNISILRLDDFLKLRAVVSTGGQAKIMIQNGEAKVNGEIEVRRGRKLRVGDVVEIGGKRFVVADPAGKQ